MRIKLLIATLVVMLSAIGSAEAQNQHRRIRHGVRNGEITRHERKNLAVRERHTHREVRRAKRDGVITPRERRQIRNERRHNSRSIYRKKHNRRDRI